MLVTRDPIVQFRSTCLFSSLFRKKNAAAAAKNFKMCCTVYNLTDLIWLYWLWFNLCGFAIVFSMFFFKEDLIVLVWLLEYYWLLFNLLCFNINFIVHTEDLPAHEFEFDRCVLTFIGFDLISFFHWRFWLHSVLFDQFYLA